MLPIIARPFSDAHLERVRGVVARMLGPGPDVDDLVQDVFVALLAREGAVLRTWDPERGAKLETFVRTDRFWSSAEIAISCS